MTTYNKIATESLPGGIARIMLNMPATSNSQDVEMLYELDTALMAAARDDHVRVIILGGAGRHFSAGHDLRQTKEVFETVGQDYPLTSTWGDIDTSTIEGWYSWEHEMFLDMCRRWRAIAKPTIAQVQGACIGAGLMLAWVCDVIMAAEDAFFQDPVVNLGVCGVEYFAHVWEIGSRRAKEKLMTADRWSARDAYDWGMVNHVVPAESLAEETLALARRIAAKPAFAVKLTKELVNACVDGSGQASGINHAYALHQLCHAHNRLKYGTLIDPSGIPARVRGPVADAKPPEPAVLGAGPA